MNSYASTVDSPIGLVTIIADDFAVNEITFGIKDVSELAENQLTQQAAEQLNAYFDGKLTEFSFAIKQPGTDFQQKVWTELLGINYGKTLSYLKLSEQMQNPLAIRAIAAANGKNKLAIVIPCHRVIGSNGSLVGYAGELWRKKWLLDHERSITGVGQTALF